LSFLRNARRCPANLRWNAAELELEREQQASHPAQRAFSIRPVGNLRSARTAIRRRG